MWAPLLACLYPAVRFILQTKAPPPPPPPPPRTTRPHPYTKHTHKAAHTVPEVVCVCLYVCEREMPATDKLSHTEKMRDRGYCKIFHYRAILRNSPNLRTGEFSDHQASQFTS